MLARTPAALKKRRYRRRLRDGLIVLRIEMKETDLAEAMLLSKRLIDRQALKRSELEGAAAGVLRDWCDRWRHKL
jgi:hypothetical protein